MSAPAPRPARRRAGRDGPRRARGASLLELVLVIMLIGATSVLAAAAMSGGFKGVQLRSSAKEISAQLRYTRTRAIASGSPQRFTLDPRARTWSAAGERRGEIPGDLRIHFTGAREVQPRETEGAIMFFPDGASTGGRVQLARDGAAWNIDVAWLTGEVRLTRAEPLP